MESLQQWRSQQQSDHHPPSAKIPKLHHIVDQQQSPALPLFAAEPNSRKPAIPSSAPPPPIKSPRFGGFFSVAQWQELELQALIYKYMLAGAPIPSELISHIRRSLLSVSTCYPHPQQYQMPMLQGGGYWGRCIVDPEPGRCRRTDGKKWRCSRETLTGHKYCERHVNRGRNRSRKHVETPTTVDADVLKSAIPPISARDPSLELCAPPVNQRPSDDPDSGVLRSFFDDWPRTQRELGHENSGNARSVTSATQLSISISGNCSSEFSLKLSTGNGGAPEEAGDRRPMGNWSGWGTHGGPLAEALRSSASTPSPTSVLQKPLGLGSASEASGFSA